MGIVKEQTQTASVKEVILIASEAINTALEDRARAQQSEDEGKEIPPATQERILEWLQDAPRQSKKRNGKFTPVAGDLPMIEDKIACLTRLAEAAGKARAMEQTKMTLSDPLWFTLQTAMAEGAASSKVHVRKAVSNLRLHMAMATH